MPGNYSRALTFSDFVLGSVETNSESPDAAAGGEVAGGEAAGGDVVGGEVSGGAAVEEEAAGARISVRSFTLNWDDVGGLPSQGGEEDVVAGDREGAQEEGAVVAVLRARIGELEAALVLCGGGGDVKGREGKEEADAVAVAAGREQERTGREGRESQREREREVRQQVEEMVRKRAR